MEMDVINIAELKEGTHVQVDYQPLHLDLILALKFVEMVMISVN